MIALTFDDVPHPTYVPRLLALLRAEKVKATFFFVGEQLKNFPDTARAVVADHHEIGNHSLGHRNLRRADADTVASEIVGMQKLLKERLGVLPAVYRPAYGSVNTEVKRLCRRENLSIVLWDIDTEDWRKSTTREMIVTNVLDNAGSGSIVLFHATSQKTVDAVAELIPLLRHRGYKFVTLSTLIRDRDLRLQLRRCVQKTERLHLPAVVRPSAPGQNDSQSTSPAVPKIEIPVLPPP